jgi:hypothetical protein
MVTRTPERSLNDGGRINAFDSTSPFWRSVTDRGNVIVNDHAYSPRSLLLCCCERAAEDDTLRKNGKYEVAAGETDVEPAEPVDDPDPGSSCDGDGVVRELSGSSRCESCGDALGTPLDVDHRISSILTNVTASSDVLPICPFICVESLVIKAHRHMREDTHDNGNSLNIILILQTELDATCQLVAFEVVGHMAWLLGATTQLER